MNVEPVNTVTGVKLELTLCEAERLMEVIGSIYGSSDHPTLQLCSAVYRELKDLGFNIPKVSSFMPGYANLKVKERP